MPRILHVETARFRNILFVVAAVTFTGCGDDGAPSPDAGLSDLGTDGASPDLGADGGEADFGVDADTADLGVDASAPDAGACVDGDGDGFTYVGCCVAGRCGTDCDDRRATANSMADETCNGLDDDCDGTVDDGAEPLACVDGDGDGRGSAAVRVCGGIGTPMIVCNDCDDTDPSRYLGASELCNDADDDCDGAIDEDCACATGTTRACGESAGACRAGMQRCVGGVWEGACAGRVAPTLELCNDVDDDCDGTTDEGLVATYRPDCDGDGFGADVGAVTACLRPTVLPEGCTRAVWVTEGGDCDDADSRVTPGAGCTSGT